MQLQPADAVRQNTSTGDISFPMANTTPPTEARANFPPGICRCTSKARTPPKMRFLFEEQQKRLGPALIVSLVYHAALLVFVLLAFRYGADSTAVAVLPEQPNSNIIWLSEPGPGGGGGGGGNQMKEPPRQAELPGKDKITVPVVEAAETGGAQGEGRRSRSRSCS